jgi:NADPH-dependent curcumin reductase CurA
MTGVSAQAYRNRQFQLTSYPDGMVGPDNYALVEAPVRELADGEALLAIRYISVDPAMRIYMDPKSFIGGNQDLTATFVRIGQMVRAWAVGEIVASRSPKFPVGSFARDISGGAGIQEFSVIGENDLIAVDPARARLSTYLGVLGMVGLTAHMGIVDVARAQAGETVVVSGAAGGVGGIAGQIAKALGCRVIGIAGGAEKCAHVTRTLGFDDCIDHRSDDLNAALGRLCPQGIDVYFDNIGGRMLDTCLGHLATGARIAGCGAISGYEGERIPLYNWMNVLARQARYEGFTYYHRMSDAAWTAQAIDRLSGWIEAGTLKPEEEIFTGLESFVTALRALYTGETIGKVVLHIPAR